jgi:putative ABC transport system permease protein
MRFLDLVSLIFDNLGRRKGRVALTAIGVVIGTAAVVVLVSLAVGLQQNATSSLYGINDLSRIDVYPGMGQVMSGGGGMSVAIDKNQAINQMKMLTPKTIEEIKGIPGVKQVIINDYLQSGMTLEIQRMMGYGQITGLDVSDVADLNYTARTGVTKLGKGEVVVGSWVSRGFYDPRQRPGQQPPPPPELQDQMIKMTLTKMSSDGLEIRKVVMLKVVGVLTETRGQADNSMYVRLEDVTAWNEWARGQRINRNKEGYNNLIVQVTNVDQVLEVTDAINKLGYSANTPQSFIQGINSFFLILQIVFGGVGAIALLVAAIGIANTMTMAILERTREIGLMKAIGATNRDVLSIFLGEAAGIGLIGGLGGVALGWGGSAMLNVVAITYLAGQSNGGPPPSVAAATPLWLPLFALIFATLVGLLSGLYPALRAATLVPVNALKYE